MAKRSGVPKLANRIRGMKAQSAGKAFESAFETICVQNNFTFVRIPNSCRTIPRPPYLVRIKSPFDYVIAYRGQAIMIDVKSTEGTSFSYSDCDQKQLDNLMACRKDCLAGYIVHYVMEDKIVFYDVLNLRALTPRKSLSHDDGVTLGQFGYRCDLHKLLLYR